MFGRKQAIENKMPTTRHDPVILHAAFQIRILRGVEDKSERKWGWGGNYAKSQSFSFKKTNFISMHTSKIWK